MGAAAAKYQALAYFSDAMSFQIVRNLGGGSLADALLFSLSEAGLMLIAAGGVRPRLMRGLLLLLRRRWRDASAAPRPLPAERAPGAGGPARDARCCCSPPTASAMRAAP